MFKYKFGKSDKDIGSERKICNIKTLPIVASIWRLNWLKILQNFFRALAQSFAIMACNLTKFAPKLFDIDIIYLNYTQVLAIFRKKCYNQSSIFFNGYFGLLTFYTKLPQRIYI